MITKISFLCYCGSLALADLSHQASRNSRRQLEAPRYVHRDFKFALNLKFNLRLLSQFTTST